MSYMLDTNVCIDLMHGASATLLKRMGLCSYGELVISTITLAELEYGVLAVSGDGQGARRRIVLDEILSDLPVVSFDDAAARVYARVRQADPQRNRNALDKLIAAHALSLGAVLVTNNVTDFQRVPGLIVENWVAG